MPRISSARREARRDEIGRAAMRCIQRKGFSATTMADIIDESGLSAGAIYTHFKSKAELIRHVAADVLGERSRSIAAFAAASSVPPAPADIVEHVLSEIAQGDIPFEVMVQLWGEAAVDSDLRSTVHSLVVGLEVVLTQAVAPWCASREGEAATAAELAPVMVAACQGFMMHAGIVGPLPVDRYLAGLRAVAAR